MDLVHPPLFYHIGDFAIMYSLLHNMCLYQCFYLSSLQPGMEDGRNCYADEHYLPTVFHVSTQ